MRLQKLFSMFALGAMAFFRIDLALAQTPPWQQTNGPEGATVSMIAVNKANGYIYAVVAGAGMMRSTDNGAS